MYKNVAPRVEHQAPLDSVELADQLVQGLKFVCESALDMIPLLSRASDSVVVLRRLIWLKCWSANQASNKALLDLPFKGERLFGASLNDIIKDTTGGKSRHGPSFSAHQRSQADKASAEPDKPANKSATA